MYLPVDEIIVALATLSGSPVPATWAITLEARPTVAAKARRVEDLMASGSYLTQDAVQAGFWS